jgi:organic hydroperoxide reductase OsmC/OhrA
MSSLLRRTSLSLSVFCICLSMTSSLITGQSLLRFSSRILRVAALQQPLTFSPGRLSTRSYLKCFTTKLKSVQSEDDIADSKLVKRKMVLVISYDGSDYFGLQMDPTSSLPTIESEVESTLHKLGCITDSNHRDLTKIQWSRSSRTDKGVHCARLCVSAKLEVSLSWIDQTNRAKPLVHLINDALPPAIR